MNSKFVDYELYSEIKDLKSKIAKLEKALDKLEDVALNCIDFVGRANYTDRIIEARQNLREQAKQLKEQSE